MTMVRFKDRSVIVTGGASGIGRAAALLLADEKAKVLAVDVNDAGLSSLRAEAPSINTFVADVAKEDDVKAYVLRAIELNGEINHFFNNAGIEGPFGPIMDVRTEDFDRVMAINARSMFLGLREVMRVMRDQGTGGSIVNTASMSVVSGRADYSPYMAAKGCVAGLSAAATWDGAPHGIRVNAVAPGLVLTDMARRIASETRPDDPEGRMADAAKRLPMGRYGTPEEIAQSVLWLLSDEASYVNGTLHVTDGGFNA